LEYIPSTSTQSSAVQYSPIYRYIMGDIRGFFVDNTEINTDLIIESGGTTETDKPTPSAKGKKWFPEEETQLLDELHKGLNISLIASLHDRTQGGITSRMREIACRMIESGDDMRNVISVTKLSEHQINDAMGKKKFASIKREEKKQGKINKNTAITSGKSVADMLVSKSSSSVTKKQSFSNNTITTDKLKSSVARTTLDHNLSIEQQCALQQFEDGDNLFVTGEGGTGKTLLIRHLVKSAHSNHHKVQVCALTGCAALLLECNARTIHSWSGIKLGKGDPNDIVTSILYNHAARNAWRTTDVLIVDEVSMMSRRIFDLLNHVGKRVRGSSKPFGGIQVVFVGDFFQLPPVSKQDDEEGDDQFCFESADWTDIFPMDNHIVLNTMFRQDDLTFRRILGNIRMGKIEEDDVMVLKEYVERAYDKESHGGVIPTKLFPTKNKVEAINKQMFEELDGESHTFMFTSKTNCTKYLDGSDKDIPPAILAKCRKSLNPQRTTYEVNSLAENTPCVKVLELKKGANVMCTVNLDLDNGICNGSIGTVVGFRESEEGSLSKKMPIVLFSNGRTVIMTEKYWQSEDYPTVAVGQFPLCLAWAITIHKIQGATLTMAEIDIGSGVFECGQTYVALSRVKNLNGLYLSRFDPKKIKTNPKVKKFYDSIPLVEYEQDDEEEEPEEQEELKFEEFVYKEGV
jgi:ATP-dependent DNA helicase PIF1